MKTATFFRSVELSRNLVFMQKTCRNVPLLTHSTFDRAEPFLQIRETFWVPTFFHFKNIASLIFGRSYSITSIQKNMHILGYSPYFDFFIRTEKDRKKPKK